MVELILRESSAVKAGCVRWSLIISSSLAPGVNLISRPLQPPGRQTDGPWMCSMSGWERLSSDDVSRHTVRVTRTAVRRLRRQPAARLSPEGPARRARLGAGRVPAPPPPRIEDLDAGQLVAPSDQLRLGGTGRRRVISSRRGLPAARRSQSHNRTTSRAQITSASWRV
jgi:hypothetical protein